MESFSILLSCNLLGNLNSVCGTNKIPTTNCKVFDVRCLMLRRAFNHRKLCWNWQWSSGQSCGSTDPVKILGVGCQIKTGDIFTIFHSTKLVHDGHSLTHMLNSLFSLLPVFTLPTAFQYMVCTVLKSNSVIPFLVTHHYRIITRSVVELCLQVFVVIKYIYRYTFVFSF